MSRTSQAQPDPNWPAPLAKAAYHGVVGAVVRAIDPETQADPAAVLLQPHIARARDDDEVVGRVEHRRARRHEHELELAAVALDGLELRTRSVQLAFDAPGAFFDALLAPYELPAALRPSLERLLASCNNRSDGGVEIDARYLLAVGRRPR